MEADVIAGEIARDQYGLVTRQQALAAGITKREVHWRVQTGRWSREQPSAFATTSRSRSGRVTSRARVGSGCTDRRRSPTTTDGSSPGSR
jgi:hypothetical protein